MSRAKKICLILSLVCMAALALGLAAGAIAWAQNEYTVSVSLLGGQEVIVEVGTAYQDAGASAQASGSILEKEGQSLPVQLSGQVDTERLGAYTLTYSASFTREHFLGNKQASGQAQRTVHVVDTQAPVITLTTAPGSYTLPGQPYEDEGFTAMDNYDGDITAHVLREEKDGKVFYTVTDSSGNRATAQRDIFYDDPIPPELTLLGDGQAYALKGEAFREPGFQALDNVDGDLTARVTVSGQLDTGKLGSYTLTYSVTDAHGNTATATRTVEVIKAIYLTFDDGPSIYTKRLLKVLDKYNVKATFFVIGSRDLSLVAEIAEKGHAIGNHTYSHEFSQVYASKEAFFEELRKCEDALEKIIGYRTKLIRFPGGSSNAVSSTSMTELCQAVEEAGYYYFDWNVDSNDAGGALTTEEVIRNVCVESKGRRYSIVLQHDIKSYSVDAVEEIIKWGLENGFTFLPLDENAPGAHLKPRS